MQAQKQDLWTEYMMPAKVHEMLGTYTGNFTTEITMWMAANQEPQVVTGAGWNALLHRDVFCFSESNERTDENDFLNALNGFACELAATAIRSNNTLYVTAAREKNRLACLCSHFADISRIQKKQHLNSSRS